MAKKKRKKKSVQKQTQSKNGVVAQTAVASPKPKQSATSKRQQRLEQQAKVAGMKQLQTVGIFVIVVGVLVGIAIFRNAGSVPTEELIAAVGINLDGPEDAPVRVVEYGDLACSACRQWHNLGIKEQLRQEFGDQVAFEYRHYPVITATSPKGAEAAQCAAEQDAFWGFHDYVYENLEAYPNLGSDRTKEIASSIGLDRTAFDECVDSDKYRNFVTDATRLARADGASSTPTFMINGRHVAPSFQSMAEAIEATLDS